MTGIEIISLVVAVAALIIAILGFPMLDRYLYRKARESLVSRMSICPLGLIGYDENKGIYAIKLKVGQGNWLCKVYKTALVNIRCNVRVMYRGELTGHQRAISTAYKIDPQVKSLGEAEDKFSIKRNTSVTLAILYSQDFDLYLFSGFECKSPLRENFDIIIQIKDGESGEIIRNDLPPINNFVEDGCCHYHLDSDGVYKDNTKYCDT